MQLNQRNVIAANHVMLQDAAMVARLSMKTKLQRGVLPAKNELLSGALHAKVLVRSAKFCARVAGGSQRRSGCFRFLQIMVQTGKER